MTNIFSVFSQPFLSNRFHVGSVFRKRIFVTAYLKYLKYNNLRYIIGVHLHASTTAPYSVSGNGDCQVISYGDIGTLLQWIHYKLMH